MAKKLKNRAKPVEAEKRKYGDGTLFKVNKTWYLKWYHNGKQFKKSLKTQSLTEAEAKAEQTLLPFKAESDIETLEILKAKIETKEKQRASIIADQRRVSWDSVMETYFKRGFSDGCSDATKNLYEFCFDRLWNWAKSKGLSLKWLDDFTIENAEDFRNHISYLSDSSYNTTLKLFKWVWKCLDAKVNVWEKFKPRKEGVHTRRDLTFDEVKKVLSWLDNNRKKKANHEFNLLIKTGIYTGMRLFDCTHLKWSEVDFTLNRITVVPHKTKRTGRTVHIPIFPDLRNALIAQHEITGKEEYVMPWMKHQYENRALSARIRQMFVQCGIKTCERNANGGYKALVSFHSLRYTFTKMMAVNHCPQNQVQKMLGHSSAKMTARYYVDDINVAERYVAQLPNFSGAEVEEMVEVKLPKSLVEFIDSNKGNRTIAGYIKMLIEHEKLVIDIDNKKTYSQIEAERKAELDAMVDEVMGE